MNLKSKVPKKSNHMHRQSAGSRSYASAQAHAVVIGLIGVFITAFISFYFFLTPLNPQSIAFWLTIIIALLVFAILKFLSMVSEAAGRMETKASGEKTWKDICGRECRIFILPMIAAAAMLLIVLSGSTIFSAHKYASILNVQDAVFSDDLSESLGTDSIALMDTASARMLGDREIGSLSNVVSQFNVSDDYAQIDYNGKPIKVAALDYAGFFKWVGNKSEGIPGYVTVNPVSMSASYVECDQPMIYVPSAYFHQDAARYIRFHYPTLLLGNLHFEIDEQGQPYYVMSIYHNTISLFGGETVVGAVTLNPSTGELTRYAIADVPNWIDDVIDGDLLCTQYNWSGTLQNGFMNSLIGKKGCKRVTTYEADEDDENDDVPVSDYGYVSKNGDIWIYTGVTSVNGDSSNIGFLLANERTGEAHYYSIAGADEKSAMAAAEGEVQEKGYQASFPSLINVDGHPTYIMVLKDASGLVKLYAAVNVEQYNIVTTASSQTECLNRYKQLLGIESGDASNTSGNNTTNNGSGSYNGSDNSSDNYNGTDNSTGNGNNSANNNNGNNSSYTDNGTDIPEPTVADTETDITIADIKYIDINGNTYIYLIGEDNTIYRAKAASHEDMLLLKKGDNVHIACSGKDIVTCEKTN